MRAALVIFILVCAGLAASGQESSAVRTHQMTSKVFENTRTIRVLIPPGYADEKQTKSYPVLYLNDGAMVFKRYDIQSLVHGLINAKAIPPMIIVGIDNGGMTDKVKKPGDGRAYEYLPYPDVGFGPNNLYDPDPAEPAGRKFPDFLDEVMAFVRSEYRVKRVRIIRESGVRLMAVLRRSTQRCVGRAFSESYWSKAHRCGSAPRNGC